VRKFLFGGDSEERSRKVGEMEEGRTPVAESSRGECMQYDVERSIDAVRILQSVAVHMRGVLEEVRPIDPELIQY